MASDVASDATTHAGQAIYSRRGALALYDLVVLGLSNPLIWRCPTQRILALYHAHASDAHLDVGVGTGWYLDHCRFPSATPRVGLLDLNADALAAASRRIARYRPEIYQADVLRPITVPAAPFRSIALTYLLHCLPGAISQKAAMTLDHLAPLLRPGGTVFGATLLSVGVRRSRAAHALMRFYNQRGVFSNGQDSPEALRMVLENRFQKVSLEVVGCAALFVAAERVGQ